MGTILWLAGVICSIWCVLDIFKKPIGIIGKIIRIKEDEIFLQTGSIGNANEKSVLRFNKWAIRDVVKKGEAKPEPTPIPTEEAKEEE